MRRLITALPLLWVLIITQHGIEISRTSGFPDYPTCYRHGLLVTLPMVKAGKQGIGFTCETELRKPH